MFERFTDRARRVVVLAQEEARMLNHNYIGTEHILLGLIREGEGVAAQVLVKLGADLNRVRQQVIQLLRARPASDFQAGLLEREVAAGLLSRINAIEARLSALEFRVGTGPDTGDLDQQIGRIQAEREAAADVQDYERAASLHDPEKELHAEKESHLQQWAPAHPDLPSVAEKVRQLSDEIERLRSLLRQQGTEQEEDTA